MQRFERAKPQIEVWRTGSDVSQSPHRGGAEGEHVAIAGDEPFVLVLQFDPSLVGKVVIMISDESATVESASAMQIARNGQAILSARLNPGQRHGRIGFRVDGITTVLNLDRAPMEAVIGRENSEEQTNQ